MPNGIGLFSSDPREGDTPPQDAGLQDLLNLISTYVQTQRAKMLAAQQQAFPSFGGQTQELPISQQVVPMGPKAGPLLSEFASRFPNFYKFIQTKLPGATTLAVRPSTVESGLLHTSPAQARMDWELGATQVYPDMSSNPLRSLVHEFLHHAYSRPALKLKEAAGAGFWPSPALRIPALSKGPALDYGKAPGMEGLPPIPHYKLRSALATWLEKEGRPISREALNKYPDTELGHLYLELMARNMVKRAGAPGRVTPIRERIWDYLKEPTRPPADQMSDLLQAISSLER